MTGTMMEINFQTRELGDTLWNREKPHINKD